MELDPNTVYDSLIFSELSNTSNIRNTRKISDPILYMNGPFFGDLIAGLLAAISCLPDSNRYIVTIIKDNRSTIIYINQDNKRFMNKYIVAETTNSSDLFKYNVEDQYYGWWLKDIETYKLYQFQATDFIQGFISICTFFDMDFRDYIAGPPFITSNNISSSVMIEGYDIEEFNPAIRIPAPISPYYTNIHEADATGEDYD